MSDIQGQVDRNFKEFQRQLPELLKTYNGKFALMHDGQVVEFFDTVHDAYLAGKKLFGEEGFSVQEVTSAAADLGYFSHAVS